MRVHVYVDGESHFIRSQFCCKKLFGEKGELTNVGYSQAFMGSVSYPDFGRPTTRVEPKAKFFWDTNYPNLTLGFFEFQRVNGAMYFTSATGDDEELHKLRVKLRQEGFDPRIARETNQLADQRKNYLESNGILEKAKGVDIGLSVRVLEDAYQNVFDTCYLFTSDIDFLPAVQAIQRIGRKVVVFGYNEGMSSHSELEYVPDAFINLSEYVRTNYINRT